MTKGGKITIGVVAGVLIVGGILYAFRKQIFGKGGGSEYDQDTNTGGAGNSGGGTSTPSIMLAEFPMRKGSRGENVRELQRALVCGKYLPAGGADGIFGSKTETALIQATGKREVTKSQKASVIGTIYARATSKYGGAHVNACK